MNAITSRLSTLHDVFAGQRLPDISYWKGLFSWSYWTATGLPDNSVFTVFYITIVAIITLALLYFRLRLKELDSVMPIYRPVLIQIPSIIIFILLTTLVYLFGRQQELPYISSRLFVLGTVAVLIIWKGIILYYMYRVIPAKRRLHLEKERFLRYIPKKKERI